jgi:hypothetical protein
MKIVVLGLIGFLLAVGGAQAAPITVHADAEPATVGIGDPIDYVVVARLPADAVEPSSVRIFGDAGPLAPIGPTRTTRRVEGSMVVVTLEQRLACLDLACTPGEGMHPVRLPAPRVVAELAGGGEARGRADPVTIVVEPRVDGADVRAAAPPYRQETALPAADRRAGRLVEPLMVATAACALMALAFAVLAVRPRSTGHRAGEAELARAVRLLRESAARPASDRRRAADLVSRVVGSTGARSIADDASELAWSASAPEPEDAVALADRAETTER